MLYIGVFVKGDGSLSPSDFFLSGFWDLKWEEKPMYCGGFIRHSPLFEGVHLRKEVAPTSSF